MEYMKEKINEKSGITLIALVITIIVLLILAGVAVSIALNGGDVFDRANQAKTSWNRKVEEEDQKLGEAWNILNSISNGNGGGAGTPSPAALPEGWDSTKVAGVKEGTITVGSNTNVPVKAPIPTGFTVSSIETEDDIAEGMVIYQGTETVDASSMASRNQFVWIPVPDINSMVMCKANNTGTGENKICDIEQLANGELHCKTHDTTGATNMCGRLYGVSSNTSSSSSPYIYSTSMNFGLNTQTFTENSGYREPDLVTYWDKDSNTSYMTAAGVANAAALKTQLQNDFYAMAKSVALYKGFYVARYGAGYTAETVPATGYTSGRGQQVLNADAGSANMW